MTTNETEIKFRETTFFTRYPCTVCGGCTDKVNILTESEPETDGALVRVCETCLQAGEIDERLEAHAQALEVRAAYVRELKGRLKVPSYEEWIALENLANEKWPDSVIEAAQPESTGAEL